MLQPHRHLDMVGNRDREFSPMGWTFPLPEDDTWSCEGSEEHSLGHFVQQENFVDEAMEPQPHQPWNHLTHEDLATNRTTCEGDFSQRDSGFSNDLSSRDTRWDCRAASGSGQLLPGFKRFTCWGKHMQQPVGDVSSILLSRDHSCRGKAT